MVLIAAALLAGSPELDALRNAPALRAGDRIAFFGDSLTWQGGFLEPLKVALKGKHVAILKLGINGAKSTDLLRGVKDLYRQNQAEFKAVLDREKPTAAVIMIGINDVWHGEKGNPVAVYGRAMQSLVDTCRSRRIPAVLCTPTVIGESPNAEDSRLDPYADVVRRLAARSGSVLVDTRRAFRRALEDAKSRSGRLTTDGVHLNQAGDALAADLMAAGLAQVFSKVDKPPVLPTVPLTRSISIEPGSVTVGTVSGAGSAAGPASVLRRDLGLIQDRPKQGVPLRLTISSSDAKRGDEAFTVKVTKHGITISSGSVAGLTWGTVSVAQIAFGNRGRVPLGEWSDRPDMPFRGLLLDVARKPHSVTTVREVIELCRLYRIRYLQLHLTDDQAFTFPSKAFPRLATPGHSYTRAELVDLVRFARDRGVILVPELEMPGHGGQLVSRMPELFRAHEKHHATLNFASSKVLDALDTLIAEACEIFTDSPYVHIGGDEADLTFVGESPDFQAAFQREGVPNADELYRKFLGRMAATVRHHGKEMLVWEGFGPDGQVPVSRDTLVMNYEAAYYPPNRMAKDGYRMINATWRPLYVVNDRNWSPAEIYAWNPWFWNHFIEGFPSYGGMQVDPDAKVLGSIMCAWEQPQEREIPSLRLRLPAMAERVWNPRFRGSFADFGRRVKGTDRFLEAILGSLR